jgi:hypothetical protein
LLWISSCLRAFVFNLLLFFAIGMCFHSEAGFGKIGGK